MQYKGGWEGKQKNEILLQQMFPSLESGFSLEY